MENEKRLIYADDLLSALRDDLSINGKNFARVRRHIENAPTVDAVEVVRCKDCDWYREHEDGICVNPHCTKSFYGCRVRTDHFCSYGERREGE